MSSSILVADDEPSVLKVVKYYAEKNGYRVYTASDGEQALGIFQDATPDLVVLDVMMPGLNGFEVCEAIRETDARVPVIFLTAKGDLVDKGDQRSGSPRLTDGVGGDGDHFVAKLFVKPDGFVQSILLQLVYTGMGPV